MALSPNSPPAAQSKKRKLSLDADDEPTNPTRKLLTVPRPASTGAQFVPHLLGTVRNLTLGDPYFIAARDHVEALTGYHFTKPELIREATYPLKKEFARIEGRQTILKEGNYRLALVGDAVIRMAILDARFELPELNGQTHLIVRRLVSQENLAIVAESHGIVSHIIEWYQKGYEPSKKAKATTVEAIIGAVWINSGKDLNIVNNVLTVLLGEKLDAMTTTF